VRVGPATSLGISSLEATASTYDGPPVRCLAQVRAHGTPVAAEARRDGDLLRVDFDEPLRAVARGQAVVLYEPDGDGDRVIGGGWISATAAA
jgi:tRNA-specific 2-thiouridylase